MLTSGAEAEALLVGDGEAGRSAPFPHRAVGTLVANETRGGTPLSCGAICAYIYSLHSTWLDHND